MENTSRLRVLEELEQIKTRAVDVETLAERLEDVLFGSPKSEAMSAPPSLTGPVAPFGAGPKIAEARRGLGRMDDALLTIERILNRVLDEV